MGMKNKNKTKSSDTEHEAVYNEQNSLVIKDCYSYLGILNCDAVLLCAVFITLIALFVILIKSPLVSDEPFFILGLVYIIPFGFIGMCFTLDERVKLRCREAILYWEREEDGSLATNIIVGKKVIEILHMEVIDTVRYSTPLIVPDYNTIRFPLEWYNEYNLDTMLPCEIREKIRIISDHEVTDDSYGEQQAEMVGAQEPGNGAEKSTELILKALRQTCKDLAKKLKNLDYKDTELQIKLDNLYCRLDTGDGSDKSLISSKITAYTNTRAELQALRNSLTGNIEYLECQIEQLEVQCDLLDVSKGLNEVYQQTGRLQSNVQKIQDRIESEQCRAEAVLELDPVRLKTRFSG